MGKRHIRMRLFVELSVGFDFAEADIFFNSGVSFFLATATSKLVNVAFSCGTWFRWTFRALVDHLKSAALMLWKVRFVQDLPLNMVTSLERMRDVFLGALQLMVVVLVTQWLILYVFGFEWSKQSGPFVEVLLGTLSGYFSVHFVNFKNRTTTK